jgi:DNA-binding transcriptional regulator YiaG
MTIPESFDSERLAALYPCASWAEIESAFPHYSRETIYSYASRLGLVRTLRHRDTARLDPLLATLVERRLALRMPPKALAHKLGVSQNVVYQWESGHSTPKFPMLTKWAKALGLALKLEPLTP